MKTMLLRVAIAGVATLLALDARAPQAWAQDDGDEGTFDHLQCYPIRDGLRRQAFDIDLIPENGIFVDENGEPVEGDGRLQTCRVQLPAREICIAVHVANAADVIEQVQQVIPGAPPGPPAGEFLCYNLRCPESNDRIRINVRDPFGLRRIEVRNRPSRLCAPATRQEGATPTPGPSPTAGEPTPTAGEPTPTPEETPTPGEPTPTGGEPTPTAGEPTPTAGEPTPTGGEPTPTAGEPTPTPASPSGAFVDGPAFF